MSVQSEVQDLITILTNSLEDAGKVDLGVKAASPRLRKELAYVRDTCQELRKASSDATRSVKKETVAD
jgi:hypothetical protein